MDQIAKAHPATTSSQGKAPFRIGIPIYAGIDLLDVAAPFELFNWMALAWQNVRKVTVDLVAENVLPLKTRDGLEITPQKTFAQLVSVDLIWVPGGEPEALRREMANRAYLDYLINSTRGAEYIASVCEGAFLLAAAGLLDGYCATTHWAFLPCFGRYPKIHVASGHPRFVIDDRNGTKGIRVTGGGISSGLDEALELIRRIAGEPIAQEVQLSTQYYPCPPVSGTIPDVVGCPL